MRGQLPLPVAHAAGAWGPKRLPAQPPAPPELSDSDSGSDSGSCGDNEQDAVERSIFEQYLGQARVQIKDVDELFQQEDTAFASASLLKVQQHLLSSRRRAAVCLICLEKVGRAQPVWQCARSCSTLFHLICIQSWARQAVSAAAARSVANLTPHLFPNAAANAAKTACWNCPKCRAEYKMLETPSAYYCFCGKERDPRCDPWLAPHTCGERCDKPLQTSYQDADEPAHCAGNHRCVLLCHLGPCPPCPQLKQLRCHCGAESRVVRCGQSYGWSCATTCNKWLACGLHTCNHPCHSGECPPCGKLGQFSCACGSEIETRKCADRTFVCAKDCNQALPCGLHKCERGCHAGPCGDCPYAGPSTCPCGKQVYSALPCDAPTPTCGLTCARTLKCGTHTCSDRCHRGPCMSNCLEMAVKTCQGCGMTRREVPCYETVACQRKCQLVRTCGRHACKRRCCDGECQPCTEICGRKLLCGNHKCAATCHSGSCLPCPVTVTLPCACGAKSVTVPCGARSRVQPPRCSRRCAIPSSCRHPPPPHRCHYGACPSCEQSCKNELPCGHSCPVRCHAGGPACAPEPPSTAVQAPSRKRKAKPTPAPVPTPCTPCTVPVERWCRGHHQARQIPCSSDGDFACDRACGRALPCGNHTCSVPCHVVNNVNAMTQASSVECDGGRQGRPCENCERLCAKPCSPPCPHPCPSLCHPGDCEPCTSPVKRWCHCGPTAGISLVFECARLAAAEGTDELEHMLSCGHTCHRKLPFCTHLCPAPCHSGECPNARGCMKKVTVRCPCRRLKQDWLCCQAQAMQARMRVDTATASKGSKYNQLMCDDECHKLGLSQRTLNKQAADDTRVNAENLESNAPLAIQPCKSGRRRAERTVQLAQAPSATLNTIWRYPTILAVLVMIAAVLWLMWKAVYSLSLVLDARELQRRQLRQRIRPPS